MMRKQAIFFAILIAFVAGSVSYRKLSLAKNSDSDFIWPRRAAELLLEGKNPYNDMEESENYPLNSPFYYPIVAAIVALPFTALPPYAAGATFFGVGTGLMGYAVFRHEPQQWPVFLSAPLFVAATVAQWSPWIFAAALMPDLQFLAVCKPNLGLAAIAYRPTRRGFILIAIALLIGLAVLPSWPIDWVNNIRNDLRHLPPIVVLPFGPLLAIGLLHWRKGDGRILLLMAFIPQLLWFYDQLILWLVPKTWKLGLLYSAISWVTYLIWQWKFSGIYPATLVMLGLYMPALVILILQYWRKGAQDDVSVQTGKTSAN